MILLALLLVPFAAGVVSALARTRRAMENANLAAFGIAFVLALAVAGQVLRAGSVSLWGGFLYADPLSALVCLLTASVALVCSVYAVGYLREDERSGAFCIHLQRGQARPVHGAVQRVTEECHVRHP